MYLDLAASQTWFLHLCWTICQDERCSLLQRGTFDAIKNLAFLLSGIQFPREDLSEVFRILHNQSKDRSHGLLDQFICEATKAVKTEISQLQSNLKQLIPPFETLFAWAENEGLRDGLLCGAVDGVLLTIVQISIYIRSVLLEFPIFVDSPLMDAVTSRAI
jgi:hypothetical protein